MDLICTIKSGDEAAAVDALRACPESAWCRDEEEEGQGERRGRRARSISRGGYPIHLAAERGMLALVEALAAMPGECVEQGCDDFLTIDDPAAVHQGLSSLAT